MGKFRKLLKNSQNTLTLLGFLVLATILFYFSAGKSYNNFLTQTAVSKPVPPAEFHGWVAWWDEDNAFNSLKKNTQFFKSISPVWYKIDEKGKVQEIPHKSGEQISSFIQQSDIQLIPTITNDFDPNRVSILINNSDAFQEFAEMLAKLATSLNYQGFDIDWEEINPRDQQSFNLFIGRLADFLHTYNLAVTVSVHAQTGQKSDREVARSYNLSDLSKSADFIKIMAYDFHNPNSGPGAITPFDKLKQVVKYSSSIIPVEKIILGLPVYGYDWEDGQKGTAVSFTQATEKLKNNIKRDKESKSLVGDYKIEGKKHTVWFEDAETILSMIALARSFGIYQFSFWRIGVEDPNLWLELTPKS